MAGDLHLLLSVVTCVSSIGSLTAMVVLVRRAADISENVARIETWTSEILRFVDPKNPRVCADHCSPPLPLASLGSIRHFTVKVEPILSGSGELSEGER